MRGTAGGRRPRREGGGGDPDRMSLYIASVMSVFKPLLKLGTRDVRVEGLAGLMDLLRSEERGVITGALRLAHSSERPNLWLTLFSAFDGTVANHISVYVSPSTDMLSRLRDREGTADPAHPSQPR